jgi:hypothetical protein
VMSKGVSAPERGRLSQRDRAQCNSRTVQSTQRSYRRRWVAS